MNVAALQQFDAVAIVGCVDRQYTPAAMALLRNLCGLAGTHAAALTVSMLVPLFLIIARTFPRTGKGWLENQPAQQDRKAETRAHEYLV